MYTLADPPTYRASYRKYVNWYKLMVYRMKTAISLDADLLKEADQTARALGLSRSRLFALALQDYLRHRRQQQILEQLNETYADHRDPTEATTSPNMKAKFRATMKDRW